jgi:hypothetical protein
MKNRVKNKNKTFQELTFDEIEKSSGFVLTFEGNCKRILYTKIQNNSHDISNYNKIRQVSDSR